MGIGSPPHGEKSVKHQHPLQAGHRRHKKMENTQDFLNALTIALVLAFAALMGFDFFAGLVDLWHRSGCSLPQKPEPEINATLPYLKLVSKVVEINTLKADYIVPTTANDVDTESLILLIQQLPQPRIRTAARRLGIADKVDGKYQRLSVLRSILKAKLKSQPIEVAEVLSKMAIQASTNKQKATAS